MPLIETGGAAEVGISGQPISTDATVQNASLTVADSTRFRGGLTDRSGTITTGGTAQSLAAANSGRNYLFIQNLDAAEDLWVNFGVAAVASQPSIKIAAGLSFVMAIGGFVSTDSVSIIAATTGHAFTAKEG